MDTEVAGLWWEQGAPRDAGKGCSKSSALLRGVRMGCWGLTHPGIMELWNI